MTAATTERAVLIDRALSLPQQPATGHNRWHPDIPPVLSVAPGDLVRLQTRDAADGQITPGCGVGVLDRLDAGRMHPLTGPVHVEGAAPGDLLEVEIVEVLPESYGFGIQYHSLGVLARHSPGPFLAHFDIADGYATSAQIPGARFRGAPFMGVMGVAPDHGMLADSRAYEERLGLSGAPPCMAQSCVPDDPAVARDGLRTIPPRANGGNLDIRQLTAGASLFLPVFVDGALFSAGDAHFAQGEGECVTGLEMAATLLCRFHLHKGRAAERGIRDPQFSFARPGPAVPDGPRRFHATTGQSFARDGGLAHSDLRTAVENALLNMVEHLMQTRGYDFQQAYLVCSLAADLRISQAVNVPNFTASVILDLSIFE
ncbi:acetamidase/formamidase family protein [Roseovarius salis]|uniref:acetamidase/formamidase family protein n=1 Tax=Roseovarius salis TaxID=3376063 RepID=UPI0037CBFB8F